MTKEKKPLEFKGIREIYLKLIASGFSKKESLDYITSFMVKLVVAKSRMRENERNTMKNINMEDILK